jgi:hypothetical protein
MALVRAGSTVVVTGTETIPGPVDMSGFQNNATTSFTVAKGATTVLSGGAGTGQIERVDLRAASGFVVTVTGGGSLTLYLAVSARQ